MLLQSLRNEVLKSNLELARSGLALYTFGNVSGISRQDGLVVIKPSGVPYEELTSDQLVITDLKGQSIEGELRPSSDLSTHLVLYKTFSEIGGITHTHSDYATAWAQARLPVPCFGTTHADYFYGSIPVTEVIEDKEIASDYENNTGLAIVRAFANLDYRAIPAVLVANHGPFAWGPNPSISTQNAVLLEAIARVAYFTLGISPKAQAAGSALQKKHYSRKHGSDSYYGQGKEIK